MNNRQIVASLNDIANTLDNAGLHSEASSITKLMVKLSQSNAPGDKPKSQYRTEPIATTKPKADYVTLLNHVNAGFMTGYLLPCTYANLSQKKKKMCAEYLLQ